ncbi:MAG: hypothetical protein WBR13_05215, partial [Allosphingosinicella sp.]
MADESRLDGVRVTVGGLSRDELVNRMVALGIHLNAHAETLMQHAAFDTRPAQQIYAVERTLGELGLR